MEAEMAHVTQRQVLEKHQDILAFRLVVVAFRLVVVALPYGQSISVPSRSRRRLLCGLCVEKMSHRIAFV